MKHNFECNVQVYGVGSPSLNGIWPEALTDQSVNCILPEKRCLICYIIPKLTITKNS